VQKESKNACPICLEPWTSGGRHRICSLKCGHLFGKVCIEKWLAGSSGGPRSKCPECNALARRPDIRVLYTKNIIALDPTEREDLARQIDLLRTENYRYRELEAALRMEIQIAKRAGSNAVAGGGRDVVSNLEFKFIKSMNLSINPEACRVLAWDSFSKTLVASCSRSTGNGFVKISATGACEFLAFHKKPCKALATSPFHDGLIASTGMDGLLQLSSLQSGNTIASMNLAANLTGWSVCFDRCDRHILWAGCSNKRLCCFDLRNPSDINHELMIPDGPPLPVHSLISLGAGGLVGATLGGGIFTANIDGQTFNSVPDTNGCYNLICDQSQPNEVLASFRRDGQNSIHSVLKAENHTWTKLVHFEGTSPNTRMTRACLATVPSGLRLAASIDETSKAVNIWHCNIDTGHVIAAQKLLTGSEGPLYDIAFMGNEAVSLAVLSGQQLFTFCASR
jgi:E3 ubiquitin-protein ligase RFWD3